MPMQLAGQVGPQTGADGTLLPLRQGRSGEAIVSELHGRYYELAYRKNLFTCYCAGQTLSLAGVAMVGLQVYNGSNNVNLVLLKTGGFISVTSATTTGILLATGSGQVSAPTGQAAATRVANNFIGAGSPQATAISAGTFTNAPTALLTLLHNTAAIATTGEEPGYLVDLEGSIIIPPQSYVAIAAKGAAAGAAAWDGFLMWEEVLV